MTTDEISLLSKGLNFIPTPRPDHPAKLLQDFLLFDRKLRLKYHFYQEQQVTPETDSDTSTDEETPPSTILAPSSGWTPPSGQDPFLDTCRSMTLKTLQEEIIKRRDYRRNLKKHEITALRNLQQNQNITIKPADKGGTIVIQDKNKYIAECERQLNNNDHYRIPPNDPTKEYYQQILKIINEAHNLNIIDEKTKETLQTKHPRIASFYTLPKIHKEGNPGRPVVNGIGTITEKLSAYVDQHIRPLVPHIPTYIKDTTHFINLIEGIELAPTDLLVTIDVSALYTSIPHNEGLLAMNKLLEEHQVDTLHRTFLCRLAYHILTKNYFSFNNEIYHQIQGTAMGTRMAPSYANIFMHQLETNILTQLNLKPDYWFRYIDDIFTIWPHGEEELQQMITIMNHFHHAIKFTHSYDFNTIPFLDTLVCRDNKIKIYTKLYHKPTDNKHYLHFHSAYPRKQKESVSYGLLIRSRRICTKEEDYHQEAKDIINKLILRKYPKALLTTAYTKVTNMSRSSLLKNSKREENSKIRLITNYNPKTQTSGIF